jgi:hypothetical protein
MRDTTHSRLEIVRLKDELMAAWSEHPFPVDKIALLTKQLKAALPNTGRVRMTFEERSALAKARWVRRRELLCQTPKASEL